LTWKNDLAYRDWEGDAKVFNTLYRHWEWESLQPWFWAPKVYHTFRDGPQSTHRTQQRCLSCA
jgi:hypothetical protein